MGDLRAVPAECVQHVRAEARTRTEFDLRIVLDSARGKLEKYAERHGELLRALRWLHPGRDELTNAFFA